MKLFGQLVRTVVNVALLPVAVVRDAVTLGGTLTARDESYTREALDTLKDEAEESDND